MLHNIRDKALEELYKTGNCKKLPPERLKKIKSLLAILNSAAKLEDLNLPGHRLHKLKAPPYKGYYSLDVTANFRIVFNFKDGIVSDVDYVDTH